MIPYPIILILSLLGFINSYFIHYQVSQHKKSGKKMYCLIGHGCFDVISSKYGTTLGIKYETAGMGYYGVLAIYSLTGIFLPKIAIGLSLLPVTLTILVALISLYLLILQMFVLKKFCFLCILAISINLCIFLFFTYR